jgi:hypothetical protein
VQGDTARLILHGVDERDIGGALDRLGLSGAVITMAPAGGYNLLVGSGLDPDVALRAELASTGMETPRDRHAAP